MYKPYQVLSSVYNIIKEIFWDQEKLSSVNRIFGINTTNNSFSLDLGYSETFTMKVNGANSQTLEYSHFKY